MCKTRESSCWLIIIGLLVIATISMSIGFFVRCYKSDRKKVEVTCDSTFFDFGKVDSGSKHKCTFVISNNGSLPFGVTSIKEACSCVITNHSNATIQPNSSTDIEVSLDTTGLLGKVKKRVIVVLDSNDIPPLVFEVRALVVSATAAFSHSKLSFGNVLIGTSKTKTISILDPKEYRDWSIREVTSSSSIVSAVYNEEGDEIICTLNDPKSAGNLDEEISVMIEDAKGQKVLRIPVIATVVDSVRVFPEKLFLGSREGKDHLRATLRITDLGEKPTAVRPLSEGLEIEEIGQEHDCTIYQIRLPCSVISKMPAGKIRFELLYSLDIGRTLSIPYCCL